MAPFVRGGAEELASHLCARLNSTRGAIAEVLRVPFSWEPFERLADEIFLNRTLQLSNVDRVIGLKFPAYLVPHHTKVLWLLHQSTCSAPMPLAVHQWDEQPVVCGIHLK